MRSSSSLLDSYAGSGGARAAYAAQYSELNGLLAGHAELSTNEASLERELDLLRHQAAEIDAARLQPGEEETVLARYAVASNSRRLIEISSAIIQRVSEADESLLSGLADSPAAISGAGEARSGDGFDGKIACKRRDRTGGIGALASALP